ncbi:hypothetical protein CICLE_v10003588mg [Citrus x clementina]|uniref:Uncharacterized protein n=1 Tax=Citrus clementina TaxID=85681 RepID=V4UZN0_CITCL|nr:hypothetical protein CICLE_v10003588mg [Citrus x clementina]
MKLGTVRKQKAFNSDSCTETMIAVNGEGNRAMQNSYGFVSFFEEAVRWIHWIKANDERACSTREVRKRTRIGI